MVRTAAPHSSWLNPGSTTEVLRLADRQPISTYLCDPPNPPQQRTHTKYDSCTYPVVRVSSDSCTCTWCSGVLRPLDLPQAVTAMAARKPLAVPDTHTKNIHSGTGVVRPLCGGLNRKVNRIMCITVKTNTELDAVRQTYVFPP